MSDEDKELKSAEKAAGMAGGMLGSSALMGASVAANAARGGTRWMGMAAKQAGMLAMQAGGKISALSGGLVGTGAGAGMAVGGLGVIMSLVLSLGGAVFDEKGQRRDALIEVCQALTEEAGATATRGAKGDASTTGKETEENAKKVFSVLSYMGMNDQNIAGILGNWSVESGVDPTSIQNIFDEPYKIGPKKQAKLAAGGFATNSTGLGLGQWTGGRAQMLLDYAEEKNKDWFDIELQLMFMIDGDNPGDVEVFNSMVDNKNEGADDPGAATLFFLNKWERAGIPHTEARVEAAGQWYAKMGSWTVDKSLASSILALVGEGKRSADRKAMVEEILSCPNLEGATGGRAGGNASAAEAMVSFAWPFLDQSRGNDGTDLYMFIHDEVYPGDPYYASCDRGVGSAVRWSGTDDTFPAGPVSAQEAYVNGEGRDKWEKVGSAMNEANLKPGDVLIAPNHVEMYVGEEAVKKVWPNEKDHEPDAVIGHASLNDRSPGLDSFGAISNDGRSFVAYRIKTPEKNSKFVDIKVPSGMKPGKGNEKGPTTTPGP